MATTTRYAVREVLHCPPGKAGAMVARFTSLGNVMRRLGFTPFRVLTDVSGERFWTVVVETEVESLDAFVRMEQEVMADEEARRTMTDYHELLHGGRREIYRVEA